MGCNPKVAAKRPVWRHEGVEYMNCLSMFVPDWAYNFLSVRLAYQNGDARAPEYRAQPRKFLLAARVFDYWKSVFSVERAKQDAAEANAATALSMKRRKR